MGSSLGRREPSVSGLGLGFQPFSRLWYRFWGKRKRKGSEPERSGF